MLRWVFEHLELFFVAILIIAFYRDSEPKSGVDNGDPAPAFLAVVANRLVKTLAFNVVPYHATTLNWCVKADANYATAEENENKKPFHHSPTGALSTHLRKPLVTAVLTFLFHRTTTCSFELLSCLDDLLCLLLVNNIGFTQFDRLNRSVLHRQLLTTHKLRLFSRLHFCHFY